jgi:ATP-dependent helicase/nuclease subunit A
MTRHRQASLRQQLASDPAASAWVNANAGSGKTHVLVDRVIRLMLAGTAPSRILCLTFTKAAAAEMALRIFERLSGWVWLSDDDLRARLAAIGLRDADDATLQRARQLFALAQETPGGLKIQTIHAFCERLLQLFPVEAGVVPHFAVMDDRAAADMLEAARDVALTEAVTAPDSPAGVALAAISRRVQSDALDELLREILGGKAATRVLMASEEGRTACLAALRAALGLDPGETRDSVAAQLDIDRETYARIAVALAAGSVADQDRADIIAGGLAKPAATLLDLSGLYLTADGALRKLERVPTKKTDTAHPFIRPFLREEQHRLDEALGRLADLERLEATGALMVFTARAVAIYEARKREQGAYDFDDLISRASSLLREKPDAAWVLFKLDGGIDHVLLDEAQDTSPPQWEIVRALTEEFFAGQGSRAGGVRTLFAVGDRKQSIYSFQGADPHVFESMHNDFKERAISAGHRFSDVDFTVSFRSAREVLHAVDTVFDEASPARRGLDGPIPALLVHQTNRPADRGLVEVWPLVEPDEEESDEPWTVPVDREPANAPSRKLARQIARTIGSWIGKRAIAHSGKAVRPGDILILVRKRSIFFDSIISALRDAGVPVAGADRLRLGENIAVLDLLALASFAVLPDDDYSLACILKSPLPARPFTEVELFELSHGRSNRSLWSALTASQSELCRSTRDEIERWIGLASELRPFEFLSSVLQESRGRFIARLGSEAEDALDALLQVALDYERDHSPSLSGFISWFQSGEIEIKRNMEQGAGEVRIMTVHGAKGLEAPIVILPDTTSLPDSRNQPQLLKVPLGNAGAELPLWCLPGLHESRGVARLRQQALEAQADEYRRLLYVAMTRARDELYVCGYRNRNEPRPECWYHLVRTALVPEMTALGEGRGWRLGDEPGAVDQAAAPSPAAGAMPGWVDRRYPAARPPSVAVSVTAISGAGERPNGAAAEAGKGRGLTIHRLLQILPETPPADREAVARQIVARARQPAGLADDVLALLADPALAWIFAADGISEVTLSARLSEQGLAVTGRIDRLIVAAQEITIVDYKTDQQLPKAPGEVSPNYLRQMALYRQAMADAYPHRAIRAILVWTSGPQVMELPGGLLDGAMRDLQASRP